MLSSDIRGIVEKLKAAGGKPVPICVIDGEPCYVILREDASK